VRLGPKASRYVNMAVSAETKTRRTKCIDKFRYHLESKGMTTFDGADVLNYLCELPSSMMSQWCTMRTAITTTLHQNTDYNLSECLMFKKAAQGVLKDFPNCPKYEDMWDLQVLLNHLMTDITYDRPNITLRIRTCTLIRISIAGRNGDVAHIDRESIIWDDDKVTLRFNQWKTKHKQSARLSNPFIVKKINDPRLCAFTHLREYMAAHADDYKSLSDSYEGVWLDHKGSKGVVPATLMKGTRDLMIAAGIDEIYGGGTIRHATITFWRNAGLSLETVMERTLHRSERLVKTFYDRSVNRRDIMADILDDFDD
jgi:hypothetical protein